MGDYRREQEQRLGIMVPVIGIFTLIFMYVALLNLRWRLYPPFFALALVPLLFYLCCVAEVDKYRSLLLWDGISVGRCAECLKLLLSMLLVALIVYLTGGVHSNYKLLFLPVTLLYSLQFGLKEGMVACSIATLALFSFARRGSPGLAAWNAFLEVDMLTIGVLFLVNWLAARTQQELTYSRAIIEQSQGQARKIAAAEEMAAATAHEIKNPLTTLRGCLQLLEYTLLADDPAAYEKHRDYIHLMLKEVDRLNGIASTMLSFTQPLEPQIRIVDLNGLVGEIGALLEGRARLNGVELRVNPKKTPIWIAIDQDQIKQVVLNIVENAFDAVQGKGIVFMKVKGRGKRAQLVIGDNGPGIAPENMGRIFEPFFSAEKVGGTGLGLAISQRLIRSNGGSLSVSSAPDQGAVFTLEFPLVEVE